MKWWLGSEVTSHEKWPSFETSDMTFIKGKQMVEAIIAKSLFLLSLFPVFLDWKCATQHSPEYYEMLLKYGFDIFEEINHICDMPKQ